MCLRLAGNDTYSLYIAFIPESSKPVSTQFRMETGLLFSCTVPFDLEQIHALVILQVCFLLPFRASLS